MEKLIVKFEIGDGYTFSAQSILPAIFSSKKEFIISFEDKIHEISKLVEKTHFEWIKNSNEIKSAMKKNKDPNAIKELFIKGGELSQKESSLKTFTLGGQTFHLDNFIEIAYHDDSNSSKKNFVLPEVLTIDEWFNEVK